LSRLDSMFSQTLSLQGKVVLNNIVQATPTTVSPTTAIPGLAQMPEMSLTITTKGSPVLTIFSAPVQNSVVNGLTTLKLFIDGTPETQAESLVWSATANAIDMAVIIFLSSPLPGQHTYEIKWATGGAGTSLNAGLVRNFQLIELG
jgi:hypothetical protein